MNTTKRHAFYVLLALCSMLLFVKEARAAGSFKVSKPDIQESGGGWSITVQIDLPKAPLTNHQPMRFIFTKTAEYERQLVDGKDGPQKVRIAMTGQNAQIESMDVDFGNASGKIFKSTRFEFVLSRERGYIAGEYRMQLRNSDGNDIGTSATLTLQGDNDVVDRRSMNFASKDGNIKKVQGDNPNAPPKQGDDTSPANPGMGQVTPTGTAPPFIPPEAYQHQPEEDIKVKKSGCGCDLAPAHGTPYGLSAFGFGAALVAWRRARSRRHLSRAGLSRRSGGAERAI